MCSPQTVMNDAFVCWPYVQTRNWVFQNHIYKQIREIPNHIRIFFAIYPIFIKFGLMGWIWIDFALLNTL